MLAIVIGHSVCQRDSACEHLLPSANALEFRKYETSELTGIATGHVFIMYEWEVTSFK